MSLTENAEINTTKNLLPESLQTQALRKQYKRNLQPSSFLHARNNKNTSTKSAIFSYFYQNTNTVLNKFVMSYEVQLQRAITKGNVELCQELIELGCNVNEQDNNKFPICLACEYNNYEIVELLIKVKFYLSLLLMEYWSTYSHAGNNFFSFFLVKIESSNSQK